MPSDEWEPQRELTVVEYKEENENFLKEGFVPVDFEEDRVGAKLYFGGVWLKSNEELSSNFCGEMTDRYYRQINFETYEIGRREICHAGSWATGKQRVEAEATKKDRKRDIF